ncbi:hypothetical protein CEXT_381461 [Caerostris extrusa]|uniref:Uncharacterized protein n=1 Tax=Caerostris extrusa TaxID=172846 RepID=A0AAV4XMU3_CAEEX|nr:hypothetical protein CEXT_381461 [Caerostris extrusa]
MKFENEGVAGRSTPGFFENLLGRAKKKNKEIVIKKELGPGVKPTDPEKGSRPVGVEFYFFCFLPEEGRKKGKKGRGTCHADVWCIPRRNATLMDAIVMSSLRLEACNQRSPSSRLFSFLRKNTFSPPPYQLDTVLHFNSDLGNQDSAWLSFLTLNSKRLISSC